jgi:hypothetical protein
MDMFLFLKVVPGALGVAGFLTLVMSGRAKVTGEPYRSIVAKLRAAPNVRIEDDGGLTPDKLVKFIEADGRARAALEDKELRLLQLLVTLQKARRTFVLLACAAAIALSVWLVRRPDPPSHEPDEPSQHTVIGR